MRRVCVACPRKGAILLVIAGFVGASLGLAALTAHAAEPVQASVKPGKIAETYEQLRVTEVQCSSQDTKITHRSLQLCRKVLPF